MSVRRVARVARAAGAVAAVVVLAACRPEASASPSDPASTVATTVPVAPMVPATTQPAEPMEAPVEPTDATPPAEAMSSGDLMAIRQRCIDSAVVLDERIDAEDFEFPEEAELDDEELEEVLTPAPEFDDGVAGPDERPEIAPMPAFDPTTVPILELDLMVESCVENGIVTEAELSGAEDVGEDVEGEDVEGEDAEDAAFCAELAELTPAEIREFVAEDGEEIVREEFAYCDLADPIGS